MRYGIGLIASVPFGLATPAVSTRLERRLKLIERMPPKPKQQLLGIIDTFLAAAEHTKP